MKQKQDLISILRGASVGKKSPSKVIEVDASELGIQEKVQEYIEIVEKMKELRGVKEALETEISKEIEAPNYPTKSIRLVTEKGSLLISWGKLLLIDTELQGELADSLPVGERFQDCFMLKYEIKVKESADVQELIQLIGQENFNKFFEAKVGFVPSIRVLSDRSKFKKVLNFVKQVVSFKIYR